MARWQPPDRPRSSVPCPILMAVTSNSSTLHNRSCRLPSARRLNVRRPFEFLCNRAGKFTVCSSSRWPIGYARRLAIRRRINRLGQIEICGECPLQRLKIRVSVVRIRPWAPFFLRKGRANLSAPSSSPAGAGRSRGNGAALAAQKPAQAV